MPSNTSSPSASVAGQKPSKTARAMLDAKMRRINAMTPRERMLLALRLGHRMKALTKPERP